MLWCIDETEIYGQNTDEFIDTSNVKLNDILLDDLILDGIEYSEPFDLISKYPLLEEYIFTNEPQAQCNNIIIVIMILRIRLGYNIKSTHPLLATINEFPAFIISSDLTKPELQELINVCIYISILIFQDNDDLTQNTKLKLMKQMCKYVVY
jgi:hypothetical protein